MNLAQKKEAYLFLSAMLRAREPGMLSREKAERMLDAGHVWVYADEVEPAGELPEVRDFVDEFLPSFGSTLDELL